MTLAVGTRVGSYEILSSLGAGGMGEVYRARDTELNRDVAIKILPDAFASDADRVARFTREAQTLAALNHPHIAQIYGLERSATTAALVMELVDGEDLAQRIAAFDSRSGRPEQGRGTRGPIPLDDALAIAKQIADALEAAHEKGIIHRDLKPANIKVTPDGVVKILDFGLAKAVATDASIDAANSPTFTAAATQMGLIVGTAAYMAPEQARGKAVDKRADIWAFGCVLYEMLAGRPPFAGDNISDIIAAVVKTEPDWTALPAQTPPRVGELLRRCLEKDPKQRLRDIGDARYEINEALRPDVTRVSGGDTTIRPRRSGAAAVLGGVALVLTGVLANRLWTSRASTPAPSPAVSATFSQLTMEPGEEQSPSFAPDGNSFVFVSAASGNDDIYVQRLGGQKAINLTADSPARDYEPAFSPDGTQIAFRSDRGGGGIFVMGATGESVRRLTDFGYAPTWSPDGKQIVVTTESVYDPYYRASPDTELWLVDVATGSRKLLTKGDAVQPRWSPDGRWIVFWGWGGPDGKWGDRADLWMVSPAGALVRVTNDAAMDWSPAWSGDSRSVYFASDRGGTLNVWRLGIDPASGRAVGDPEPVTAPTPWVNGLDVSRDGKRIVFEALDARSSIWRASFDPQKGIVNSPPAAVIKAFPAMGSSIVVSPDAQWVAFSTHPVREELFLVGTDGSGFRQLTDRLGGIVRAPAWAPDGQRIAFYTNRGKERLDIWAIRPDGSGLQQLSTIRSPGVWYPTWSPDGRRIVAPDGRDVWVVDLTQPLGEAAATKLPALGPGKAFIPLSWSADGRYLAGHAIGSGGLVSEGIIVYSFDHRAFTQISDDGISPQFLSDSRRMLFQSGAVNNLGAGSIHVIDRVTRARHPAAPAAFSAMGWRAVTLSRDNRTLVYGESTREGDIWLMTLDR